MSVESYNKGSFCPPDRGDVYRYVTHLTDLISIVTKCQNLYGYRDGVWDDMLGKLYTAIEKVGSKEVA